MKKRNENKCKLTATLDLITQSVSLCCLVLAGFGAGTLMAI